MDAAAVLAALEASAPAVAIRNSVALFPLIESLHVVGLTLVFGTIAVLDLRLLGLASTRRAFTAVASDVLPWTWVAFAITVVTGVLMFATNATTYYPNAYFRAKIALLALSGVNMMLFELTARRTVGEWDREPSAPRAGRIVAAVSLTVWVSIIVLGRWVGFTSAQAMAPSDPSVDFGAIEELLPK